MDHGKARSVAPEDEQLSIVLTSCEFFEPSEEFGITKALEKCEAELRPKLPSDEQRVATALTPLSSSTDTVLAAISLHKDDV